MELRRDDRGAGEIDWQRLVTGNWDLLNRLARRRFGDGVLAEEAALMVMDKLLEQDAIRLKRYDGRGKPRAFIAAVSWRLLEDFARNRYGRKRPPAWVCHLGGVWERLYTLLCLERIDIMDAVRAVAAAGPRGEEATVEEAAWAIRRRITDCGVHQGLEVELEADGEPVAEGGVTARLEEREKAGLLQELLAVLTDLSDERIVANSTLLARLNLRLSGEERLLLRLSYVDELSTNQIGRLLELNRFQVHGRRRRLLARLRGELKKAGLDRELLVLLD